MFQPAMKFAQYLLVSTTAILCFHRVAQAQYEMAPICTGNEALKAEVAKGSVSSLSFGNGIRFNWASSVLLPATQMQSTQDVYGDIDEGDDSFPEASDYSWKYSEWTSTYGAVNLSDHSPATAWAEGESGPGIGEVVIASLDKLQRGKKIRIWPGYGKSQALYLANNRPREVKLYLLETTCYAATPCCGLYTDLHVVLSWTHVLADKNNYQEVSVPEPFPVRQATATKEPPCDYEPSYFIAIEILSVYKGTRYDDTCISEVSVAE
jgi:hypothetical protein